MSEPVLCSRGLIFAQVNNSPFSLFQRYDHNKNDKILPISLEPSSSTEPTQSNLR